MWDAQTKRGIIQRIQEVSRRTSEINQEPVNNMFHQFLEVITQPDGTQNVTMEESLLKDLSRLESQFPGRPL